jgi:DNA-binding beta-propeller fold protein YncE
MKFIKNIEFLILVIFMLFSSSCVDKLDINDIDTGSGNVNIGGDTLFVQVNPVWEGFNKPRGIMVGKEPFIYVADTENNKIVLLNLDGQILSSRSIQKPVAIAQDYRLNLIVCAQFDTLNQTFSAVYKLDLVSTNHNLDLAPIKRILPQLPDFAQPQRVYTGCAAFFDNTYYIARKGPNNSNLVDPDNSVLVFIQKRQNDGTTVDSLIGRVPQLDPTGSGINSANQISSITSYNSRNYNMILSLTGENNFKIQPLEFIFSVEFTGYRIEFSPLSNALMTPNVFERPEGATVDNAGNIYVADAETDTVYKFNSFGDLLISFGGPDQFNEPYGVAFFDKTLYVADTGNDRIVRFILSTDF